MRKILLLTIVGAMPVSGCGTGHFQRGTGAVDDPSRFTYTRLYCTADNESHFGTVPVELAKKNFAPPASPIYIGGSLPASNVFFAGTEAHWGAADLKTHLYHPAPAEQFAAVLKGDVSITATDGETRQFHVGDVIRVEDVTPCKGHITVAGDQPGFVMFVR